MKLVQAVGTLTPQFLEILHNAIDKHQFKDVTTPGANVEFEIEHGFGVIPVGYLVIKADQAGAVYLGATAWDTERIYLKATAATMVLRILVF